MASMTMAAAAAAAAEASLLPTNMTKNQATSAKRGLMIVAKASAENVSMDLKNKEESSSNGRRELVFAAAAAACSIAKVAMADDEPMRGSPDARKKYAPICVTMPTAKICHK